MIKQFVCLFCFLLAGFLLPAQKKVILGDPGGPEIKIQSSDTWKPLYWADSASAEKTIKGQGLIAEYLSASRFLAQASFGANLNQIKHTAGMDYANWIKEQQAMPSTKLLQSMDTIHQQVLDWYFQHSTDSSQAPFGFNWIHYNYAWWDMHIRNPDKLRQRIALALSEFFVISANSDLYGYGRALADYYDIFLSNAFGNYRTILNDISLHPAMGFYLSHLNNPKTIPEENQHPDENFAREIMQLFSIGLYELNNDGSRKKDSLGNDIPTYGVNDIKELAKVFTGLGMSKILPNMWSDTAYFGLGIYGADMTYPMRMYEDWHEPGKKTIVGNYIIPEGQSGMKDIQDALDHLFHHPNVGPFFCKQMIQRLIKSNPTPEYVNRIAKIFNDNGKGVRGDLSAVFTAILLDPEARDCEWLTDADNGQLREPFIRYAHFVSASDIEQYYERYWFNTYDFYQLTGQAPMASPSVFNFFSPFYAPNGSIKDNGIVAPEFQIHNSRTSIGYINLVNSWAVYNYVGYSWENSDPYTILNTSELESLARDPEVLINRLDMLFTHGNLSDRTRAIMKEAMYSLKDGNYRNDRVRLALYLMMISPDYVILK